MVKGQGLHLSRHQEVSASQCSGSLRDPQDPKKARMTESKFKVMCILFFDINRTVMIECVPSGQAVNQHFCIEGLKRLREKILPIQKSLLSATLILLQPWPHLAPRGAVVHINGIITDRGKCRGGENTTDEAHFWLNGYVNKQNCRIWSEANPQVYVETLLHPEKLTVWCALWAGGILLQK
ncbi:hypothetical protein TNCV_168341 [Trichonephila clavipes]|nr:hypothetical protein TNCV_168341 [Trichonephila clavipes]